MAKTQHYQRDLTERKRIAREVIGYGEPLETFYWDRGHHNGPEDHVITSTGLIFIYNHNTKKLVTLLIARPAQISRYYEREGRSAPESVLAIAAEHQEKGYNLL